MADLVDMASEIEAEHIARSLARVARAIPAGAAGECEDCGEHMPRIVAGRCAYCRDGRQPPLSRFDTPSHPPLQEECLPVPNPPPSANFRNISVLAKGDLLRSVEAKAAEDGTSLAKAAASLVEAGLLANAMQIETRQPEWDGSAEAAAVVLANVSDKRLVEELVHRFDSCVGSDDYEAAVQRAEAAEARAAAVEGVLASLKESLKGLVA